MEYYFIALLPGPLRPRVVVPDIILALVQINLVKNHSYSKGTCSKKKKSTQEMNAIP